jgi:predicted transglutaminase-like cysteine proteinase
MKIRLVGAELFHTDGQTDRHVEANISFSQFCERAKKNCVTPRVRSGPC